MNTVIVVPIKAPEDPICPHCDRRLPGWTPPDENFSLWTPVITITTILFIMFFIGGLVAGPARSYYRSPEGCLVSYVDYSPKYLGCKLNEFLSTSINKK
jgi:hypothetical protein